MENKIANFLKNARPSSSVTTDAILRSKDLFADGIVDSLLNLKLLAFIETEAGVKIPPLKLSRQSFMTVSSIAALVSSTKSGS